MTTDERGFVLNGRKVCSTFLVEAFRFSRDMQLSVKKERMRCIQSDKEHLSIDNDAHRRTRSSGWRRDRDFSKKACSDGVGSGEVGR